MWLLSSSIASLRSREWREWIRPRVARLVNRRTAARDPQAQAFPIRYQANADTPTRRHADTIFPISKGQVSWQFLEVFRIRFRSLRRLSTDINPSTYRRSNAQLS